MATVEDRWQADPTRTRKGRRWLLRWRDPDGRARKLSYRRKADADAQKSKVEADALQGAYLDPKAGRQTVESFAAEYLAHLTCKRQTLKRKTSTITNHVNGTPLGRTPLAAVRPMTIQQWVRSLTAKELEPSTIRTNFRTVSTIFESAANDGVIGRNPCKSNSVVLPQVEQRELHLWSEERIDAMRMALTPRFRPLVDLGVGLGLRPAEAFGLAVEDIDWLRGSVRIRRQVKIDNNTRVFDLPKEDKERVIPVMAENLLFALSEYLRAFPAQEVTLPWQTANGAPTTVQLLMTNTRDNAMHPPSMPTMVWNPALRRAGIPEDEENNGQHALRHYFVSSQIHSGEDPYSVAKWTGHSSVSYMHKIYGHPRVDAGPRSREAVDKLFSSFSCAPYVPHSGLGS